MPPMATKSKYGKNLYVLHFDSFPPPGEEDVVQSSYEKKWPNLKKIAT